MSVQTARTQHPLALFCLSMLGTGPHARAEAANQITLAELAALPKQTQLLLAHCLEKNHPEMTLLNDDTDVCKLLSARWLTAVPCRPIGIVIFRINPVAWRRLRSLRSGFLSQALLSDLKAYRHDKSARYPWNW